jgi:AcrR family transcriptional regulator
MGTIERREREKLQRREDIVRVARTLFFEKGFRDTTIDEIARAAELARGTIYLYFENKEEIYVTVLEEGLDILQNLVQDSVNPDVDPLTNLLNGHDAFMRFHDDFPQYYNVMMLDKLQISHALPPALKERIDARMMAMVDFIAASLEEGARAGYFRPMPFKEVALLQMGISTGFAQMMDKCGRDMIADGREHYRQIMHDLIAMGVVDRSMGKDVAA